MIIVLAVEQWIGSLLVSNWKKMFIALETILYNLINFILYSLEKYI